MSERVFVIAEAGSCHDNSYASALRLIQTAKQAGADACKFQFWSSPKRLAERRHAEAYFPVYAKYQLPEEWLPKLAQECRANGIEFMCTTYLPEDIEIVAPHVQRFKVASFEAGDVEFVDAHKKYDKDLIISCGMGAMPQWNHQRRHWFLHCVSAYPAPVEAANLSAIGRDDEEGFVRDGYSDHTKFVLTGAFATCAGARILEVHFRLNDTDPQNPDYGTALSPSELAEYVSLVRLAEKMLGDGVKRPQACEAEMSKYRVGP